MSVIYFPMTCNILTAGHIKCLKWLSKRGDVVVVGLLTAEALRGYKKELVPFEDRLFILNHLDIPKIIVVPQLSLNPEQNVLKYNCDSIASGDGWEPVELDFIKRYNIKQIDVRLEGETTKQYSSTAIVNSAHENSSITRGI